MSRWLQEELEQWTAVAKQKEDDNLAMEKYMRQDEARVKELNMQVRWAVLCAGESSLGLQRAGER